MHRWMGLVALCLALTAKTGSAQETTAMPPLLNRAIRGGWLRFELVDGRFVLHAARAGNIAPPPVNGAWPEKLNIGNRDGQPLLEYELTLDDRTVRISTQGAEHLSLTRQAKSPAATTLQYLQTPGEPVSFTVGEGDQRKQFQAATLWHLLLEHPRETTEQLVPLLHWLRPDSPLAGASVELEEALLRAAAQRHWTQRGRWRELITRLGDDHFAEREAADRELRAMGPSLLPFLRQIDFAGLDAEQQYRIERIVRALQRENDAESILTVAATLLADRQVWLILMARPQESTRRLAAEHLTLLAERPIDFDPAADEATRQRQLAALRQSLVPSP